MMVEVKRTVLHEVLYRVQREILENNSRAIKLVEYKRLLWTGIIIPV
jgi:hypothetical protein